MVFINSFHLTIRRRRVNIMSSFSVIKTHACRLCDRSFAKKYNLRRHIDSVHCEEQSVNSEENSEMEYNSQSDHYEPLYKRPRSNEYHDHENDEESSEEDNFDSEREDDDDEELKEEEEEYSSSDLEDNPTYQDWLEEAKADTEDIWKLKYEKYINEGMSEHQAREKANMKTLWAVKRNFFARFKDFLSSYVHLKDENTYQEIIGDLEEKMEKGMDINKALNRVVSSYKSKFTGLFHEDSEEEEEEEEESDNDEGQ